MQVLIVDDSRTDRMLLREMIRSAGHDVEEAENGKQALEMARSSLPDMIVSDIMMPVMDGFQLCRKIRNDKRTCDILFVFYTGTYTRSEDKELALRLGADRFLVKPLDWAAFGKELRRVTRNRDTRGNGVLIPAPDEEAEIYKMYNARLVHKLEDKVAELEREAIRRAEEQQAHEKEKAKYRNILENIEDGYFEVNLAGALVFFNKALVDILGYTESELQGLNYQTFMDRENAKETFQAFNRVFISGKPLKGFDWKVIQKNGVGRYLDASVSPIKDIQEQVIGFRGIARDVTDRRLMEKFLAESEENYRVLFESAPIGIFHYDKKGIIQSCNQAYVDIKGSSFGKLIGFNLLKSVTNQSVLEAVRKSLAGTPGHYEGEYVSITGGKKSHIRADFVPVFSDGRIQVGGMCVVEDIAEQKTAEDELKKSRRQLRALSKHLQISREQERAGIAREIHDDLGQYLTAIKMDVSWLQGKIPEDQQALWDKAQGTLSLIDSTIQTVKRISAELRPGLLDDLGLSAAIEWQAGEYQKRSGIHIHVTMDPEEIFLDEDLSIAVFRVCQESMTNVIRHSGATEAWIHLAKNSHCVELTIKDNGSGINEAEIAKKDSFGLIGMRERIHAFEGKIQIFRIREGGTKVAVQIPLGG